MSSTPDIVLQPDSAGGPLTRVISDTAAMIIYPNRGVNNTGTMSFYTHSFDWQITGRPVEYYNQVLPPEFHLPDGVGFRRSNVIEVAPGLGPMPLALREYRDVQSVFADPAPYAEISNLIECTRQIAVRDIQRLIPYQLRGNQKEELLRILMYHLNTFSDRCAHVNSLIKRGSNNQLFVNLPFEEAAYEYPNVFREADLLVCTYGHGFWMPGCNVENFFGPYVRPGGTIVTEKGCLRR